MVFHKKTLIEELCVLDGLEEVRALVTEEKLRKTLVISELEKSPKWRSWRQQSRVLWLIEGDKCMKFFHWVTNSNRRNKSIEALHVSGYVSSDQFAIRGTHCAIL
jgi:hypothetical protein